MAKRPDLPSTDESDGMDRVELPTGYMLGEDQRVEDVLAVEAELLRSEGIDPTWPGFEKKPTRKR
jgi:hypothetical protein